MRDVVLESEGNGIATLAQNQPELWQPDFRTRGHGGVYHHRSRKWTMTLEYAL